MVLLLAPTNSPSTTDQIPGAPSHPERSLPLKREAGFSPAGAVMVEDMAKNLAPAAALGMRTVWLRTEHDWARDGADAEHVHHVADDLLGFLESLVGTAPDAR